MFGVFCDLNAAIMTSLCFLMVRRILFLALKFFASNKLQRFFSWVTFRDLHFYLSLLVVHPSGLDWLDGVGGGGHYLFPVDSLLSVEGDGSSLLSLHNKHTQSSVT